MEANQSIVNVLLIGAVLAMIWTVARPLMVLSANRDVDRYVGPEQHNYGVEAAKHIFKGAFVGLSASGHAQPLVAGNQGLGIAAEESDNSSGADAGTTVDVWTRGDFHHALAGAALTNIGDAVYASADDTLTFTSTSNTLVGTCIGVPASGEIILRLDPHDTVA